MDKAIGVPNVVPRALLGVSTFGLSELVKSGNDAIAEPGRAAKRAQDKLEEQRRATLAREAADRAAAKKRAETAGQRAGLGSRGLLVGPLGAGSGDTAFGSGPGTLFGN